MLDSRGMIRWQPFASIKEQFQGIQKLYEEQHDVSMPILDEQRLEEIDTIVCAAMAENLQVSIMYHKNNRFATCIGYIHYFDTLQNELRIVTDDQQVFYIKTNPIVDIRTRE